MENGGITARQRPPRYADEDTTPTTKRELRGWYAYALAAEVYAVCGVGSFLPVILEQLARLQGVRWSDKITPCCADAVRNNNRRNLLYLRNDDDDSERINNQCIVNILGAEITTASFAMYTFSLAVFVQALALISFSAVADYGNYRKRMLVTFGFVGATTAMLFIFIVPQIYLLGALLVVIGVTCLGSSFVLLNSFLPLLVLNHPAATKNNVHQDQDEASVPLQPLTTDHRVDHRESNEYINITPSKLPNKSDSTYLRLSTTISSRGVGIGYLAAAFVQTLSIFLIFLTTKWTISPTLPLRLVLFLIGLWWFLFTIPSSLFLRSRPGPPFPTTLTCKSPLSFLLTSIKFAWSSLYRTLKLAVRLKKVLLFLIAWFLLSDAIGTVSGTAILFASTELQMETVPIALLSITATLSGLIGAFTWPWLSRRFNMSSKRVIILCILLMEIIPLYGLLGFLPFFQKLGWGGLQQQWEIFPLAFIHGVVMGGLNSYCRSFFGLLIPKGKEAAFYALYAVTDKGSSAVGPAVVGRIVDNTGSIRQAFWFLAVLILVPVPLIGWVDVERGKGDARCFGGMGKEGVVDEVGREDGDRQEVEGLMRDHD